MSKEQLTEKEQEMIEEIVRQIKKSEQQRLDQLENQYENDKIKRDEDRRKNKRQKYGYYEHIDGKYEQEKKVAYGEVTSPMWSVTGICRPNKNEHNPLKIELDSGFKILEALIDDNRLLPGTRGELGWKVVRSLELEYDLHKEVGNVDLYNKFISLYDKGIEVQRELGSSIVIVLYGCKIGLNMTMEIGGTDELVEEKHKEIESFYDKWIGDGLPSEHGVMSTYCRHIEWVIDYWESMSRIDKLEQIMERLLEKQYVTENWRHLEERKTADGHTKDNYEKLVQKLENKMIEYDNTFDEESEFWGDKEHIIKLFTKIMLKHEIYPSRFYNYRGVVIRIKEKLKDPVYQKKWDVTNYQELEDEAADRYEEQAGRKLGRLDWADKVPMLKKVNDAFGIGRKE